MGIKHENADAGAESDQFRDAIGNRNSKIVSDKWDPDNNVAEIVYINGEGDSPLIKYRLTLEAIGVISEEEYEQAVAVSPDPAEQASAEEASHPSSN